MAVTEFTNIWGYGRQSAAKLTRPKTPVIIIITIQLVLVSGQLYMNRRVFRKKMGEPYPQLSVKPCRLPGSQLPTCVDVVGRVQ